jgi:predicted nucleic acid-binding protein
VERAFVDTSAWFALANRSDPEHGAVRDALRSAAGRLVTSSFVFDETVTLCRTRLGHAAAVKVGGALRAGDVADLVRIGPEDERNAWTLFVKRADQPYSFTDCTSFVLMRRLRLGRAIALDDDFRREGFEIVP